jgi:phosphate/sulfate permease
MAILGMAVSALLGIGAMLAFITISWPDDTSRYVVAVFVASVIGFMTSASLAVFSAARDTYPRHRRSTEE